MVSEILITGTLRERILIQHDCDSSFCNDSDHFTNMPLQKISPWSMEPRAFIDFLHHKKRPFSFPHNTCINNVNLGYWDADDYQRKWERTERLSLLCSPRCEKAQWSSPSWPGWNQCSSGPAWSSGSEPWAATLPCSRWGWPAPKTRETTGWMANINIYFRRKHCDVPERGCRIY